MDDFRWVEAAGIRFRVCQRGSHPDTLFIHGFSGDLATWDLLWRELGEDFAALRYDLRGFGQSPQGEVKPFSHADDLAALLDSLGIARCNLVGVSLGGAIAINAALNFPERVSRLVVINPALVAWEWSEAWRALWRPIVNLARAGDMAGARALWWQHPLFATTRQSAAAEMLHASIERFAGDQWIKDHEQPELPDVERLYSLEAPVLLLTGGADLEDFRLIAELLAASAPELTRLDVPGRGHLLHLEEPAICAQAIRDFLIAQR